MEKNNKTLRPTYDINKSYEENYRKGPFFNEKIPSLTPLGKKYRLLGFELRSPLGVAAGLLLNSKWVKLYSDLGFDILTYKTVRSTVHPSHSFPNCLYIDTTNKIDTDELKPVIAESQRKDVTIEKLSITNSFGVPSASPEEWRKDISKAKGHLKNGQILIVSVVGTYEKHKDVDSFIEDFSVCAKWAKEAGADIIELDLSCPNSPIAEGDIFRDPELSSLICERVKKSIGKTPLLIKIGYFDEFSALKRLIEATVPFIDGVAGINTIKKKVVTINCKQALPGKGRDKSGVCGALIRKFGLASAKRLVKIREEGGYDFAIIGIGGAMTPEHIEEYMNVGVDAVQVVTAAMYDPFLAYKYNQYIIRKWSEIESARKVSNY